MENYISAHEYENNVNPPLKNVPLYEKNINDCEYGLTFIDFSNIFNVAHKSTSPNLLASFIKIKQNSEIKLKNNYDKKDLSDNNNYTNGTSHLFFILQGDSEIYIDNKIYSVSNGDLLITPYFNFITIKNTSDEELQIYYINDSPLVNYLGNMPIKKLFKTAIYSNEFLIENLNKLSNPNNNRKGILLSNEDTEKLGINTITPVLWALYNELPPNTVQRPHKHNSVALDLCITCEDSDNVYTLMGEELDESGNIINPVKVNWKKGGMFVTPPGLWHSHNNNGSTYAYVLPIQDAGILLYQRILGIILK